MKNKAILIIMMIAIAVLVIFSINFINKEKNILSSRKERTEEKSNNENGTKMDDNGNVEHNPLDDNNETPNDELAEEPVYEEPTGKIEMPEKDVSVSSSKEFEGYKKADEDIQKNYEITDVKFNKDEKLSTVKGLIKNINGKEKVIIKVEFYDSNNNLKGSSSDHKEVRVGSSSEFEIKTLNNVATDNYKVLVEYVGE